ncbi:BID domain-containing T4SS effector [Bartonella acomydis]|uniref:Uncharacterized protein n=1 Tax=Bartonella acomydis TaxID=686234 RepID=A0ABP9MUP8_9HYPH
MRKNQPPSFSSPSVQKRIKLSEQAAAELAASESLCGEFTPRDKTTSTTTREDRQESSLSRTEQRRDTTATSSKTSITLSEEQITQLLHHSRLVTSYQEEIRRICKTVYGNSHALQEKIEEIIINPAAGENLSSQITINPRELHRLAGKQMLGIKSSTRKIAEENLSALCGLVDCYIEAVKVTRADLAITPLAVLPYYEQLIGKETLTKILQTSRHPARENASLKDDEIADKMRQHPVVKRHYAQIEYWCQVVFGKSDILQQKTEGMFENSAAAEELSWQIAAYPQSFGRYAGVNMCGLKNKTRKTAEAGLSHLISAVDNYANAIQQVKESIVQTQQITPEASARFIQDLSVSLRESENISATPSHHETAKSPQHSPERIQDTQSRKAVRPKMLALAS